MIRITSVHTPPRGGEIPLPELAADRLARILEGARLTNLKLTFTIRDLKNFDELSDFLTMIKPCFK